MLPQRQAGIFDGVVIVDIEVAFDVDFHTETAVGSDLIQHVIKEANAGVNLAATFAIQPHGRQYASLWCCALHGRNGLV